MKEKCGTKLKIRKGQLGLNKGYLSQKLVKGSSGKGKKSQRAIQSLKSLHKRVKVELKMLLGRIRIVGHAAFSRKIFESWILVTPNVHCSNTLYSYIVSKYELFVIYGIIINENPCLNLVDAPFYPGYFVLIFNFYWTLGPFVSNVRVWASNLFHYVVYLFYRVFILY